MKLIRDARYIREDYKINENLIEFEINKLQAEISSIDESSIVALVGSYGTGKSTSLYNLRLQDEDKDHRWFQFDAWRYPERKGLWDGLIIELAKEIGIENKAIRKIDGNKSVIGKWGGIVGELFGQFGDSLPKVEIEKITLDPKTVGDVAKISEKASAIFGRSPAKRAYEMERILADVLLSIKEQNIYLIAEDVDRSGADGINFLETLNYFIKNNEQIAQSSKKIVVIAPISEESYKKNRGNLYKCIDLFIEYHPIVKSSRNFLQSVFTDEALGRQPDGTFSFIQDLEDFTNTLLETTSYRINLRILKLILRHTNQKYVQLCVTEKDVDWRAVFVVEAMRIAEDGVRDRPLLQAHVTEIPNGTIFSALLRTIHTPSERIFQYKYSNDRSRANRYINSGPSGYKFIKHQDQVSASVWEGWTQSGNTVRGYIADYYQ